MPEAIAKAKLNHLRQSPYKMREVADLVRGQSVSHSLSLLRHTKKRAAVDLLQLLESAVANLQAKGEGDYDDERLYVSLLVVDEGPTLKRYQPMSLGRAGMVRKRTCRVRLELGERPEKGSASEHRGKA
ncbi:MAG: 50S ribosomal protein L22 [Acidobacteriota bacterium]|nr:MAG: 50S ribosomal protein L22 [Acidobacteriota bacterium]